MTTPERSRSTGSEPRHEPVLAAEIVSFVVTRPGGLYVDATVGLGGHTAAMLEAGAGRVIGIDRDPAALAACRARFADAGDRVVLVHADYREIRDVLHQQGASAVDGVMADFGVSSMQLDDASRGFSFRQAGPLDMRMDQSRGETLAERLATVDEGTLADVIFHFGEERKSRRVAREIVAARSRGALSTTADLATAARRGAGGGSWQRIDPATRTFQALRIWVNAELDGLHRFVEDATRVLAPGGRLAVLAFHSLEDRVIKQTMRRLATEGVARLVTRRPVMPADEETDRNPRARSARLRVLEKAA
jgi:16S rRNA (cytosine1402-N4)-methyltransferase